VLAAVLFSVSEESGKPHRANFARFLGSFAPLLALLVGHSSACRLIESYRIEIQTGESQTFFAEKVGHKNAIMTRPMSFWRRSGACYLSPRCFTASQKHPQFSQFQKGLLKVSHERY
jgi:hypothetical protein